MHTGFIDTVSLKCILMSSSVFSSSSNLIGIEESLRSF